MFTDTEAVVNGVIRNCCRHGREFRIDGAERVCQACRKPRPLKSNGLDRPLTFRKKLRSTENRPGGSRLRAPSRDYAYCVTSWRRRVSVRTRFTHRSIIGDGVSPMVAASRHLHLMHRWPSEAIATTFSAGQRLSDSAANPQTLRILQLIISKSGWTFSSDNRRSALLTEAEGIRLTQSCSS